MMIVNAQPWKELQFSYDITKNLPWSQSLPVRPLGHLHWPVAASQKDELAHEQRSKHSKPYRPIGHPVRNVNKTEMENRLKSGYPRYVVSFDCNFWSIRLIATTSKKRCKYLRSQWEIRTKTSKRSGALENVSDQQTVGFNFTSDRSRGWHEFTSQRSRKKLMTSQVAIVTPMKIAPKTEKTNFDPPRTSCKGGGGGGGENTYVWCSLSQTTPEHRSTVPFLDHMTHHSYRCSV